MNKLVLSLFPGIGLLDIAFERTGFCVVRGPDLLWGGDVHRFHPPYGVFDGIIGGPPCQAHSRFASIVRATGKQTALDLIPEFERVVSEAHPHWFLMENVPTSPTPLISGYGTSSYTLNNRWLGEDQHRIRKFTLGILNGHAELKDFVQLAPLESSEWCNTVLASGGVKPGTENRRGKRPGKEYGYLSRKAVTHALRAQGLPEDFLSHCPLTVEGMHRVIGNGVPLPMGNAIAHAVCAAIEELS